MIDPNKSTFAAIVAPRLYLLAHLFRASYPSVDSRIVMRSRPLDWGLSIALRSVALADKTPSRLRETRCRAS